MEKNLGADTLRRLINDNYKALNRELLSYSAMICNNYLIKNKTDELPLGRRSVDLVKTVIEKVLAPVGEGRNWNPKKNEESDKHFVDFLKGQIKGELSNLIRRKENATAINTEIEVEEGSINIIELTASGNKTDEDLVLKEMEEEVIRWISKNENSLLVFQELKRGVSNKKAIMENTGLGRRIVDKELLNIRSIVDKAIKA